MAANLEERANDARKEPLIPRIRVTPQERNRLILVGIAGIVLWWLLSRSMAALAPFIVALILAYLMTPLIDRLDRFLPRPMAILLVYLIFLGSMVALIAWLLPLINNQIQQLQDAAPTYSAKLQEWTTNINNWYHSLPISDEFRQSLENSVRNGLGTLASLAQEAVLGIITSFTTVIGAIVGFLIIPFWLFYVLKDKEKGINAFNEMIPRSWRGDVWRILRIINGVLSSYIRGQLVLALSVAIATTIGMLIIGAPFALLLGVMSGLTEVIPIIGPYLGAVPGVVIALFSGDWVLVLKVVIVYVVVQQLENNLLVPKIQGDSVNLHPAIIMVALVVGSQVAGFPGLILAVPVAAIMRDVYLYLYRRLTEDYTPKEAEASVPSKYDEDTGEGEEREAHELAEARRQPGINTENELIADLDQSDAELAGTKSK